MFCFLQHYIQKLSACGILNTEVAVLCLPFIAHFCGLFVLFFSPHILSPNSRCLANLRPLLDSGTMGTKGHTEIIVPQLTESYNSHVSRYIEKNVCLFVS